MDAARYIVGLITNDIPLIQQYTVRRSKIYQDKLGKTPKYTGLLHCTETRKMHNLETRSTAQDKYVESGYKRQDNGRTGILGSSLSSQVLLARSLIIISFSGTP